MVNHLEWVLIALIYVIVVGVVMTTLHQQRKDITALKKELRSIADDQVDAQRRMDIARLHLDQVLDTRSTATDPLIAAREELNVHYLYPSRRLSVVGGRHR